MPEMSSLSDGGEPRENADANWLQSDEPRTPTSPTPSNAPAADPGEGYGLEGGVVDPNDDTPAPPIIPPVQAPPRTKPKPAPNATAETASTPTAKVDEVWSRSAEWGPTFVRLGIAALAAGLLIYLALSAESYGLAFAFFVFSGAVLGVLSYPIIITLERPVRVTPEQAVKDFYAALSHFVPHYRRMWLLLSSAGKTSGPFASYEGFKAHWNERLDAIRSDRGRFNPLRFEVQDFRSEKSAGQTALDASYTVAVTLQGHRGEVPIETVHIKTGLVKGPDRMWYLNQGTLPPAREG